MKANNKTIVVTGGGSGIGRELVLLLLEKGARVATIDINEAGLNETKMLAKEKADRLSLHVMNITDKSAIETLPQKITDIHGSVDGIINNAGIIQPFVKINDLDFDAIKRVIDINLYGVIYMTKSFLPGLLKRPEAHIINISSMGGFLPVPGQSIYGASKAAVKLLTEGLYSELSNTNVKVTVVFPGAIATNITTNSGLEADKKDEGSAKESKFKALSATKAAEIIIEAMEENKFRVCVGKDSKMMDRLYRFNPRFATEMIAKKMAGLLNM